MEILDLKEPVLWGAFRRTKQAKGYSWIGHFVAQENTCGFDEPLRAFDPRLHQLFYGIFVRI